MLVRENLCTDSNKVTLLKSNAQYAHYRYPLDNGLSGKTISISFKIKIIKETLENMFRVQVNQQKADGKIVGHGSKVREVSEFQSLTVELPVLSEGDSMRLVIYPHNPDKYIPNEGEIEISKLKIELGEDASIWTPYHGDLTQEQKPLMKYGEYEQIQSF